MKANSGYRSSNSESVGTIPASIFTIQNSSMDQRARMFKTLGCLVGAMTGTSMLLAWIDPSPPISTDKAIPYDVILRRARSLVTDNVVVLKDRWDNVEVFAGFARTSSAPFLTARSDQGKHHFHIDLEGRASRTSRWPHQEGSADHRRDVRIRVALKSPHQPMSRTQVYCVQALIIALREVTAETGSDRGVDSASPVLAGRSLPIRLDDILDARLKP